MKKWIITILMVLLMIQIVYALTDCSGTMTPSDLPCTIISSWTFPNDCGTYTIKIFNETPSLLRIVTMDNYTSTGRCNITFGIYSNETKVGSYLLNWSSGDSSKIVVEVDKMSYVTIGILLGIITFVFAYLTTRVKHWFLQIALSLFTLIMVFFDFFISARIIEIIDSSQTGMIYYLDTFFKIGVIIFRYALASTIVFLIYYMYKHILVNPERKRKEREEEGFYGQINK